jgi:pimeloyl-ACP methyl ester carboxylesterase
MSPDVRETTLRHGPIRFVDAGRGPALLLIHGLGGNWQNWQANLDGLARRHRVIVPDLPGFGGSPAYPGRVTMARYADTLVEVLDELGIDQATFVGNSMGGLLSIEAALRHPDRVTATMLVCSGGIPLTTLRHRAVLRPGALALNTALRHERIRHAALRRPRVRLAIAARIVHRPHRVEARYLSEALDGIGARAFGPVLRAALRYDARPYAPRLNRPTLIVWGRHDRLLPLWMGRQLHALIPNSELAVWDDAGHCPMIEHPARFNDLVANFAGRHPSGSLGRSDGKALPSSG